MPYISPVLTAMANAAKKASVAVTRDFNELEHLQNSVRKDNMFAVRSAGKAERTVKEELAKIRPAFPFVCKPEDTIPADGNYFLLKTIDGFGNFVHGNSAFALSLALVENGTVTHGVVYAPIYDELFFAEKGSGAFKEGFRSHERLRVAGAKDTANALIRCTADTEILRKALTLSPNTTVSGCVSLDLAHLAAGKLDAVAVLNAAPETLAAGMLLLKESGGYIVELGETDVRSEDFNKVLFSGKLLASNEALRQKVANTMAKA